VARLHPHTGVPTRAILLQSIWASVLILSGTFEQLIVYSGLVLAFFIALTLSTIFPLRVRRVDLPRSYRTPFYPILPAALIAGALCLVIYSLLQRPVESLLGAVTVLGGIPLYMFWKKSKLLSSSKQLPTKPQQTKG